MREIKFRAWNNADERWLQEDQFHIFPSGYVDAWEGDGEVNNKDVILTQFTGLKDKKGKEIYEGDIVKGNLRSSENPLRNYIVEFKKSILGYAVNEADNFDHLYAYEIEVIGNIYENPELLKGN